MRFAAVGMIVGIFAAGNLAAADRPPNIVFILADDLGYGDLGCYGQKRIRTPNLDRLAAAGTRFTAAYAGSTVCAPSRYCLMSGFHTGHGRVRGNAGPQAASLTAADTTVAKLLRTAGYRTAVVGKWGLGLHAPGGEEGLPTKQGFDEAFGFLGHMHAHNYYPSHLFRNEKRVELPNLVPGELANGAGVSANKRVYAPDLFAAEAIKFVSTDSPKPFFLYFAGTAPHANNEAKDRGMEVPDLGEYANLPIPAAAKGHAAMVTRFDRDVGRLLDALAAKKLDANTLVFFSSDNGPHKEGGYHFDMNHSNGPLRGGKRDLYEGGVRVPMIVRGPGVAAGAVNDSPWAFWDFLPTAAELAGVKPPAGIDGVSVVPLLRGKPAAPHAPLYWEFHEGGFAQAVRDGDWKAVRLAPGSPLEIFDLSKDVSETRNVAADNPAVVAKFEAYLKTARTESEGFPIRVPKVK